MMKMNNITQTNMTKVFHTIDLVKALDEGKEAYWNMSVQGKRFKIKRLKDRIVLVDTKLITYEPYNERMLGLIAVIESK